MKITATLLLLCMALCLTGCYTTIGSNNGSANQVTSTSDENFVPPTPVETTVSILGKLRAGPNHNSEVIAELSSGASVKVIGAEGIYLYVEHASGKGYISQAYVNNTTGLKSYLRSGLAGISNDGRTLYSGAKGGCFYINENGNKTYVDRSECSSVSVLPTSTSKTYSPSKKKSNCTSVSGHWRKTKSGKRVWVKGHTRCR